MRADLTLLDDDAAAYAEYSANFGTFNAEASGWNVDTFSIVKQHDSEIIGGRRGHVYLGCLECAAYGSIRPDVAQALVAHS